MSRKDSADFTDGNHHEYFCFRLPFNTGICFTNDPVEQIFNFNL
jgi:hypothetical protein